MKRIITTMCLSVGLLTTSASAQDDVSIMDLKETVYLLLKDVKNVKKHNTEVLTKMINVSDSDKILIEAMADEIQRLKKENIEIRNTQVLPDYKVDSKLKTYIKK